MHSQVLRPLHKKASKLANLYHFSCKTLQSLLALRLINDAYKTIRAKLFIESMLKETHK
jgi:hypothetical protein